MRRLLWCCGVFLETFGRTTGFHLQALSPTRRSLCVASNFCAHDPICSEKIYNETVVSYSSAFHVSRRDWFRIGIAMTGVGAVFLTPHAESNNSPNSAPQSSASAKPQVPKIPSANVATQQGSISKDIAVPKAEIKPVNLTMVAAENKINISVITPDPMGRLSCICVDPKTFTKLKVRDYPKWWPEYLKPPAVVVREFTNSELLIAGSIAGATIDIIRSSILYPIATIKTRIQAVANKGPQLQSPSTPLRLKRRILVLYLNIRKMVKEGNLYAGLVPTLLVSVPATGLYFGTRDVTKRLLYKVIDDSSRFDQIAIALTAAFLGDVVSLAARTPVDTLALRLQVASGDEEEEDLKVGDWFRESIQRLPTVIATDLPYLLSRITFNMILASGNEDMGRYEIIAITTAVTCAILTTPFDVARTRILVDGDGDPRNGLDGGSRQGVIKTLGSISREGDGGIRNLYAGWFERALYLGIGRAWIDPILLITYVAIRDSVLLEWFD